MVGNDEPPSTFHQPRFGARVYVGLGMSRHTDSLVPGQTRPFRPRRAARIRAPLRCAMTRTRTLLIWGVLLASCVPGGTPTVQAQGIEVTPFGGYRFGNDFFELITRRPVDTDGSPAVGAIVDIPLGDGLQVEGLFTHQDAHITMEPGSFGPLRRTKVSVDHWQGGALQEYMGGRVRPFANGLLGLTRYAGDGDSEIRFTLGAGGGVKLFATQTIGLRLNGQVSATFVYFDATALACGSGAGVCFVGLNTDIVWQAEFSAGLIVKMR